MHKIEIDLLGFFFYLFGGWFRPCVQCLHACPRAIVKNHTPLTWTFTEHSKSHKWGDKTKGENLMTALAYILKWALSWLYSLISRIWHILSRTKWAGLLLVDVPRFSTQATVIFLVSVGTADICGRTLLCYMAPEDAKQVDTILTILWEIQVLERRIPLGVSSRDANCAVA